MEKAGQASQNALSQSELRFRTVFERAPIGIAVVDRNGHPILCNPALQRFLGYTEAEFRLMHFREFTHPEDVAKDVELFHEVLDGKREYYHIDKRYIRKDSHVVWGKLTVALIPLSGEAGHVIGIVEDVTDSKAKEMDRERLLQDLRHSEQEIRVLRDQLFNENLALKEEIDRSSIFQEIVGTSPSLQATLRLVAQVAPTDSTVLITGETGTGKELIARAIHKRSQRSDRAFVSVSCAAIPQSLIGSELFGHEKGAFTGAVQRRLGRFELANGGTIFLDEVGELPGETQGALLRVLQERALERIGGNQSIRVNVRVVAATNRDLSAAIRAGVFRSDLFYRLNVFPIEIAPLRERKEDIPSLLQYFLGHFARKVGKKIREIDKNTLPLLQAYAWPGNIREFQNVIERSVIASESEKFRVDERWLSRTPSSVLRPDIGTLAKKTEAEVKEMIEAALIATRGRISGVSGAAAKLGIPASTLESKIRTLGIDKRRFREASS